MNRRRDTAQRAAATFGLLALVVLDIALVVAALRVSGPTTGAATPLPDGTAAPAAPPFNAMPSGASPEPTSTTSSPTSPSAEPAVPLTVVLSAVDGSTAWRATVGTCASGGAAIQITTDGGRTWRNRTSPFPVVTRVQATDASRGFAVGASDTCEMAVRNTTDGGGAWHAGNLADTIARDAKDPTKVRASGRTVVPCNTVAVVDVARNSTNGAQALCADGFLRSSTDDGQSWTEGGKVEGALALDSRLVGGTVTTYVARTKETCEGVAVGSVVNGTTTDLGCAATGSRPEPGTVTLAAPTGQVGWLLVAGETWRSSDGLQSWTKAS